MSAQYLIVTLLNGTSYGLLLFMLSAGLTLIFSLMGVLNFAHASFYMLGAYLGWLLAGRAGFVAALLLAPLLAGLAGAAFERWALRRAHPFGHMPELLATFGLAYVLQELVQLAFGRGALEFAPPPWLQGAALTLIGPPPQEAAASAGGLRLVWGAAQGADAAWCQAGAMCTPFAAMRAFMAAVALGMLGALWLLLARTRLGLVVQAALTHPQMAQALGHDVPRVQMTVFGCGTALAALAGVLGGSAFVTEPGMAQALGPVIFVVVMVGGLGSLGGAFAASLLLGLAQTLAVALDVTLIDTARLRLTLAQLAPVLPYLLLVLTLAVRPQGLMGRRLA